MRRIASIGFVAALLVQLPAWPATGNDCRIDPVDGAIVCSPSGTITDPGSPGTDPPPDDPGKRYVHTDTDPVIGDCHYWSNVPGGLDAWDPANDPAVIAIVTSLPLCPGTPPTDPETRAWDVFRSWDLDAPDPQVSPAAFGITGLPTHITAVPPPVIAHREVLPDGRTLEVRARVASLDVDWGDGTTTTHRPSEATGPPDGRVAHTYDLKTCTPEYRSEHPSGGLCHPELAAYPVTVDHTWVGEYRAGGPWVTLGALVRSASFSYDVDEALGVPTVP